MELIHLTAYKKIDCILLEGLKTRKHGAMNSNHVRSTEKDYLEIKSWKDVKQQDIDSLIDEYKPKKLKKFMSLDNCIFFTEINDYKKSWEKEYGVPYGLFKAAFKVEVQKLDLDKLYLSGNNSSILNDLCELVVRISHKKREGYSDFMIERWTAADLSLAFWNQLIPYKEYIKNATKYKNILTWPFCYEFMYFDNVPQNILTRVTYDNY